MNYKVNRFLQKISRFPKLKLFQVNYHIKHEKEGTFFRETDQLPVFIKGDKRRSLECQNRKCKLM